MTLLACRRSLWHGGRFPAQETISGASKIPTIIYYDPEGNVRAVGAEATRDGIFEEAMEGGWVKSEWWTCFRSMISLWFLSYCFPRFKLHLRSKHGDGKTVNKNVSSLPPNKTVVDVFADFLRYLMGCAATYIQEREAGGIQLWNSLKDEIHFVLSHPNGWEGKEQSQMRQAVIKAGLVQNSPSGHDRISFVTEGEASLHFAIEGGILSQAKEVSQSWDCLLKLFWTWAWKDEGIVIVDAGGGTIDVSTYKKNSTEKSRDFQEISVPQCLLPPIYLGHPSVNLKIFLIIDLGYFQGSLFVNFRATDFLKGSSSYSASRNFNIWKEYTRVSLRVQVSQRDWPHYRMFWNDD